MNQTSSENRILSRSLWIVGLTIFSLSALGFFYNLHTTLSDYTWGDADYQNQIFSNFIHHRPFQMSLYHNPGKGVIANPFPLAHEACVHVNFTPFLFTPLYALHPTISGLYGLIILLNVISFLGFGYRWLRIQAVDYLPLRFSLLGCFLLGSSFLFIWQSKNHFILFLAPFVLLAHEALKTRRPWLFALAMVLWCLVSEDSCMFALTFGVYIYFFEQERRAWAVALLGGALLYLLAATFVIQPAARWQMVVEHYNHSLSTLRISQIDRPTLIAFIVCSLPIWLFLPAFACLAQLQAPLAPKPPYQKALAMFWIAPLSSWVINLLNPAEQHFAPNMVCTFIAFLYILSTIQIDPANLSGRRLWRSAGLLAGFIVINAAIMRRNIPMNVKLALQEYRAHRTPWQASMQTTNEEQQNNRELIALIGGLPIDATVVHWTNRTAEGFFSNRPNLWRFPEYYDQSDVLVIQRNAQHTWLDVEEDSTKSLDEIIKEGIYHSSGEKASIDERVIRRIVKHLVMDLHTHVVTVDSPNLILLSRISRIALPDQPETTGLGWLKNVQPLIEFYRTGIKTPTTEMRRAHY